jgi:hypothetical protein
MQSAKQKASPQLIKDAGRVKRPRIRRKPTEISRMVAMMAKVSAIPDGRKNMR